MDFILGLVVGVALGFAFRGAISKEVQKIGDALRAEYTKALADIKSKI